MNSAVPIFQNGAFVRDEFELCGIEITKERVAGKCRLLEKQNAMAQKMSFFSAFLLETIEKHRDCLCYGELRTPKQEMQGLVFVLSHSKCNTSKAMAGSVVKV
jgi:hypothetical protein